MNQRRIISDPGDEIDHIYYAKCIFTKSEHDILYSLCKNKEESYRSILKRTENAKDKISWQNHINQINIIIGKLKAGKY